MSWVQASREHYCVNKTVMKKANKDEECTNLIGEGGAGCANFKNTASKMYGQQSSLALQVRPCQSPPPLGPPAFAVGSNAISFAVLDQLSHAALAFHSSAVSIHWLWRLQVHDIEDLCRFGKTVRGCPYFAARHYAGPAPTTSGSKDSLLASQPPMPACLE